jgi:hypothetical protein
MVSTPHVRLIQDLDTEDTSRKKLSRGIFSVEEELTGIM